MKVGLHGLNAMLPGGCSWLGPICLGLGLGVGRRGAEGGGRDVCVGGCVGGRVHVRCGRLVNNLLANKCALHLTFSWLARTARHAMVLHHMATNTTPGHHFVLKGHPMNKPISPVIFTLMFVFITIVIYWAAKVSIDWSSA